MSDAMFRVERLERNAADLKRDFGTAHPFPHVVLDDVLQMSPSAISSFPDLEWDTWNKLGDLYQHNKRACNAIEAIPEPFTTLIRELCQPRFLKVLEEITGIRRLLPDPYLVGGGLHLSGPGGVLSPHTDFHYYRGLDLYRRINVLIYLNEDWTVADGGCLTLYDGMKQPAQTVVPTWGRVVIFQTDDRSVHGFPVPVAEGKWRRSVALYYYTAAPTETWSGDETTHWKEHGEQSNVVKKGRFALYRALLNLSRAMSMLAHVVNPNQGLGRVKALLANRGSNRD